jgi:hypothetical protein
VWEEWGRRTKRGGSARPLDSVSKEFDSRFNVVGVLRGIWRGRCSVMRRRNRSQLVRWLLRWGGDSEGSG